ncbi:MAG: class I SAM-dependent methyltransferase [Prevotellaceae bacterium]|jgi:ubiquinone/menaquinone biosynthesis C-methylase UbiE|nr:class I SAM-dependent methyltransferase [Prevotellaceae bacterium]
MKKIPDFSKFWATGYDDAFYGKGLLPYCMRKSHKLIEAKFDKNMKFNNVVEIGSGIGYHLDFVNHQYDTYTLTDINQKVIEKLNDKSFSEKIKIQKLESEILPFSDNEFDRLIAVHVLEHIYHPEKALREWSRVVKNEGIISILLPCDPGIAWRLGRYISSQHRAHKNGVNEWDLFVALEHVNSINGLMAMIRYFFEEKEEKFWPFFTKSMDMNLFYAVHIQNKKDEK